MSDNTAVVLVLAVFMAGCVGLVWVFVWGLVQVFS